MAHCGSALNLCSQQGCELPAQLLVSCHLFGPPSSLLKLRLHLQDEGVGSPGEL